MGSGAALIPMVKADAYGLGVERAIEALDPLDPWGWGVATVEEGEELRRLGVERPILVVAPIPPGSYDDAVRAGLTLCLSDLEALDRLAEAAARWPTMADVTFHVEVDTGIGRAGFAAGTVDAWGPEVARRHGRRLRWTGCFTHLHSADVDEASVVEQKQRFERVLERLELPGNGGPGDFLVHLANSAGALRLGERLGRAVRPGIHLYGGRSGPGLPRPEPVMSVRARVVLCREVPPGTTLGYGATYRARTAERWATLGIGYGDGLPRALGNVGHALLAGERVPIMGRMSMDVTVVNISELDGVGPGDVATLVGRDGMEEIELDEVAEQTGTIGYEILTGLGRRLPRIWMDDDEA